MTARPRIGFDLSPLAHPASPGVRRAAAQLWRALAARRERFEWIPVGADSLSNSRWWRQFEAPRLARRLQLRGWHATVSALPWFGRMARVQTVHEIPWRMGSVENTGARHRSWARSRRADATIVPSRATYRALCEERGGSGEKVHVVPWGVGAPFTLAHGSSARAADEAPVLVVVGGTRPKKRLDFALDVLAACPRAASHELCVTGAVRDVDRDWIRLCERRARELGLTDRLRLVGELAELELARLLHRADAVLVVSESEGFGLPALEAAATGTPCVVRALSAPEEAAGSGAFPFAAGVADAARALASAIDCDEARRESIRKEAAERSWERTAEQVETLWGTLLR